MMNIYGDESGSINNRQTIMNPYFVICLVRAIDAQKLRRVYKRFVSANLDQLISLDASNGKMFKNGKFHELKGSCFDKPMKKKFVDFFSKSQLFELYYIVVDNSQLTDNFCANTARAYNYLVRIAISFLRNNRFLPDESCILQLDERNERTETKSFLENYLNTELVLTGTFSHDFKVQYYDSSQNALIQVADVFSNIMYSHCMTHAYTDQMNILRDGGLLKYVFKFPIHT